MRKRVRSHSFRQPILNPKVYQTARRKRPEKNKDPSHPVEKTRVWRETRQDFKYYVLVSRKFEF